MGRFFLGDRLIADLVEPIDRLRSRQDLPVTTRRFWNGP